jgi:hypothetical protein
MLTPLGSFAAGQPTPTGSNNVYLDSEQVTGAEHAVTYLNQVIRSATANNFHACASQLHAATVALNPFALQDASINEATDLISQALVLADAGQFVGESEKSSGITSAATQAIGLIAHSPGYLTALGLETVNIHQVRGVTASYTASTSMMSLESSIGDVVNLSACQTEVALLGRFNAIRGNGEVVFSCSSSGGLQMEIDYPVNAAPDAQYTFRSFNLELLNQDCANAVTDLESLQAVTGELGFVHAFCVKGVLEFTSTIN